MKNILFLLLLISTVSGCKCKKLALETDEIQATTILNNCLEKAVCTQDIFRDLALDVQIDGTGKPFYTIVSNLGTTVYRYQMVENKDSQYQDGGYREELIFELPSFTKDTTLSGKKLSVTKALFGVFCYCKGKAGYYPIKVGTIQKAVNTVTIEISKIVEGQKVFTHSFK